MKRKIEPLIFQVLQESSTWSSLGITENVMAESCKANVYFEYDILVFCLNTMEQRAIVALVWPPLPSEHAKSVFASTQWNKEQSLP